jgi:hypothetical protein
MLDCARLRPQEPGSLEAAARQQCQPGRAQQPAASSSHPPCMSTMHAHAGQGCFQLGGMLKILLFAAPAVKFRKTVVRLLQSSQSARAVTVKTHLHHS